MTLPTTPFIHIHRPDGYYIGQKRQYGFQRWQTVTGKCKTKKAAMIGAIKKMKDGDKRARVLLCCEWYEPLIVFEASI